MLRELTGFSISRWLFDNVLHQNGVNLFVQISIVLLFIGVASKIFSIVMEQFPPKQFEMVEPEELMGCLSTMNREMFGLVNRSSSEPIDLTRLKDHQSFQVNMRLITQALAEHIRKSIQLIKIKQKDLFISVYDYDVLGNSLSYALHYDPRRDLVKSKSIGLTVEEFKDYECVKCLNAGESTTYVLNERS